VSEWRRVDGQRGDESILRVCPVQMVVVHSQSVNDVVDTVELCGRRVGQQRVDRLAACTRTPSAAVSVAAVIHVYIYLC